MQINSMVFLLFSSFEVGKALVKLYQIEALFNKKSSSVHIQQNILHIYNLYTILNITQYSVHKFLV